MNSWSRSSYAVEVTRVGLEGWVQVVGILKMGLALGMGG